MNKMMRGREGKVGALPSDLLVCFPSRNRLALMPKPARSPARSMDKGSGTGSVTGRIQNNHHQKQLHRRRHHQRRSLSQGGKGSPTLWAKTKVMESSEAEEPTSPKVTCVGQIKVKSNAGSCKNWESVMKEIEKLHKSGSGKKKKPSWIEALGLKKELMQFFGCFRRAKLDLPCFGSYHPPVLSSDDEEEDDDDDDINVEEEVEEEKYQEGDMGATEALFSKWFMVLKGNEEQETEEKGEEEEYSEPCAPPPNALLLMRCRSAPAKTWLEEKLIEEQEQEEARKARLALEEKKSKENLILQYYGPDFYMVSSDIAKETWVAGGTRDPLPRSRSSRR